MVESPVQHRDLGNSTNNQAHRLHEEQVTRGNLLFLSAALIKNRTRYSDTCIAVNPELKILRKGKTFGGGYGPKGKKPDVSKDFPFPNISSNQAAEKLNANFCICGCEYPSNLIFFRQLWVLEMHFNAIRSRTGMKKTPDITKARIAPYQRSCTA